MGKEPGALVSLLVWLEVWPPRGFGVATPGTLPLRQEEGGISTVSMM